MSRTRFQTLLCLFALLLSVFMQGWAPALFAPIDHTLSDWRTRFAIELSANYVNKGRSNKEERIVIIDIDERSFAEQGRWPWSREKVADLIRFLIDDYGVAAVALDMVIPESEQGDSVLASQLKRPEVTGAVVYDLLDRNLPDIGAGLPQSNLVRISANAPRFQGIPSKSNHQLIMPNRLGHITPLFDSDGSIRRLPPVICSTKQSAECRPLMEIVAFASLIDGAQMSIERVSSFWASPWVLKIKDATDATIASVPLNPDGSIQVPYRHTKQNWIAVSASDILNHKIDRELLKGTIAMLGSTALGMADVVATPVSSESAGLEPHAEVLSALFDEGFLFQPKYCEIYVALFMVLAFAILTLMQRVTTKPFLQTMIYPVWLASTWILAVVFVMYSYLYLQVLLPATALFLFPPLTILLSVLFEMYRAATEKIGLFDVLSTYIPKSVAKRLSDTSDAKKNNGHEIDASRREITVLFADIRGFTGLVENCKPEIVAILMHRIFGEMASAVVNHGGTIDKFIGDAVMAFWNAPEDDPAHAQHAFAAAQEMLERIQALAEFCRELGIEPVSIGVGIETGQTLVGHFGSGHRRTYTALGETVVLASRLEGLSGKYDQHILIGQSCAAYLSAADISYLGKANIRGRQQMIDIYGLSSVLIMKKPLLEAE